MQKVILTILDGYGLGEDSPFNAVRNAQSPNLDKLFKTCPLSKLTCSGKQVGLPEGTMGNSEVGHLNIGAGRIVWQDISQIDNTIENGSFFTNPDLVSALEYAKSNHKKIHLLGLLSDGGVHSSMDHLKALIKKAADEKIVDLYLHLFTDGRDTPPNSAAGYLADIEDYLSRHTGKVASLGGRFYGMDRDKRWQRVEKSYRSLVQGEGETGSSAAEIISNNYAKDITDEFIVPSNVTVNGKPIALIGEGDVVIFFNFRSDRAREMTIALNDESFTEFPVEKLNLRFLTMTSYREDFHYPTLSPKANYNNLLGKVIADQGLKQLRIAETEKFAHVTFFFNGGFDTPFDGEERILVPSPKVETYDLQPEMSAIEVTDKVVAAIESREYSLIILNFANCDMVGHTGVYKAAVKAVETVDACMGRILESVDKNDYTLVMTADHGNSEKMLENDIPFTAHTKNPVPFIVRKDGILLKDGILADIAPTILKIMDISIPAEMTGKPLF